MKFERLRLSGFKTFVDQTDLLIAPGLTGIVGPNGCGKSNLVEALRWAMGETSSKSLRGGGMEDVIFSGSGTRPERNHAEVLIKLIDPPKDLPGSLVGAESLEITRKITRDQGSTFRINGREARARDVQILFADAASGARSPSMVRQGQISEIIAAKPQHRQRILEDAAGVAGLHARRHEAELRLRQAEDNLTRAEDVLGQLDRQMVELKKQARQSQRYKALAAEIRGLELRLMASSLVKARAEAAKAQADHDLAIRAIAITMAEQGESDRKRAVAAHELEGARGKSAEARQHQQDLLVKRQGIDAEIARISDRITELELRRKEAEQDKARAETTLGDADGALAALEAERAALTEAQAGQHSRLAPLETAVAEAAEKRGAAEQALSAAQSADAHARAGLRAAQQALQDAQTRQSRLEGEHAQAVQALEQLETQDQALGQYKALEEKAEALAESLESALKTVDAAESAAREARVEEQGLRPRLAEAERLLQRLETEARTIRKLVDMVEPGLFSRVIDKIAVEPGFETALAAALGDDLEAALEASAPRFWRQRMLADPPALPGGIPALLSKVAGPPALVLRLSQIGIVGRDQGSAMQAQLSPGQRLVSVEGDLWRWDGYVRKAEAPSAAAKRLAERNRLGDLERDAHEAQGKRDGIRGALDKAARHLRTAQENESTARDAARRLQRERDEALSNLSREMRRTEEARLKLETLKLRVTSLASDLSEANLGAARAQAALAALPPVEERPRHLENLTAATVEARQALDDARARLQAEKNEAALAEQRLATINREHAAWIVRKSQAMEALSGLTDRTTRLANDLAALDGEPDRLALSRQSLAGEIANAESTERAAGDALAVVETSLRFADEAARLATSRHMEAREAAARIEANREAILEKLAHVSAAIEAEIGGTLAGLDASLKDAPGEGLDADQIEIRLADLREDRNRLGVVNLRADIELGEVEIARTTLAAEREEITEAIRKLRRAISQLNSEGRERLRAAFDVVNAHFTRLFTRLFGGGEASLQLVEAEDPLEAGLDILAKPPGKKPQLLSLLSGGEQALTATALIFAVFLTNPSPICVLDEVDAPLDDANVERLCDLLGDMASETETRFLVITHNPITMARMSRLYGVTMVERGVSQLVSVDLAAAEQLAEAV